MLNLVEYLPAKRKQTPSGWISFNAPCCQYNGTTADKRQRGGLIFNDEGWSYHCFNCGYKASFVLGRSVSFKTKRLLGWFGVPEAEISALNLESLKHRSIHGILDDRRKQETITVKFSSIELPDTWRLIDKTDVEVIDYLKSRHIDPWDYPYMIDIEQTRKGVLIPFSYEQSIVGHTTRFLDDRKPKYLNNQQQGYVFNTDRQYENWEHVLVMEGIFDALSVNGVALMHNNINDLQARLIRNLGKEITVVPDQDEAGVDLINRAVELGWAVSIPNWDGCKDVNDAVKKYGKLATIFSIMQARETSKVKIEIYKKKLLKKIKNDKLSLL